MDDFKYRFITDDGMVELTHDEYLKTPELRKDIGIISKRIKGRSRLFLGKTIVSYSNEWLADHPKKREHFILLAKEQKANPFRFFLPHRGAALEFLNDFEHNLCGLFAPNRFGKSTVNWIKKLVSCMKCDPKWEIFTEHGVKYRDYEGFKDLGIYSYQKSNFEDTLWPQVILKWTPQLILGKYSDEGGRRLSFRELPNVDMRDFHLWFKSASQAQGAFESQALNEFYWDEQPATANFIGANERLRTTGGRHDNSATPHKIDGRHDTGANGLMSKMYRKEINMGLNTQFYLGKIDDIPDWVYPQEQKDAARRQWVDEPKKNRDYKALREGMARYYGMPHEASGQVIDNFNRKVHLIDRFDIPEEWSKYRAVDHGRVNPTAMLNVAVSPEGNLVFYQEYYQGELDISRNVQRIVEVCGNKLVKDRNNTVVEGGGQIIEPQREIMCGQRFVQTKLDSRSFAKKMETGSLTLGQYYRLCGLNCTPASGQSSQYTVPIVNDWFKIDWSRKNPFTREDGWSKAYVFRDLRWMIFELENWIWEEPATRGAEERGNRLESPRKKNDHLMTALLYIASIPPRYIQGASETEDYEEEKKGRVQASPTLVRDSYTGY
jgi:hypothetical protein